MKSTSWGIFRGKIGHAGINNVFYAKEWEQLSGLMNHQNFQTTCQSAR